MRSSAVNEFHNGLNLEFVAKLKVSELKFDDEGKIYVLLKGHRVDLASTIHEFWELAHAAREWEDAKEAHEKDDKEGS